jgi:hypothetical protein
MDKKASFELSMNFIVIIIISLVLMGIGIKLISMIWGKSTTTVGEMDKYMSDKLASVLDDGSLVASYPSRVTANRKKMVQLGVGVRNELGSEGPTDFTISVEWDDRNSPSCDEADEMEILYSKQPFPINNNEKQFKLIGLTMPGVCTKGTHIFNIYACTGSDECFRESPDRYGEIQKIFVVLT